MIENSINDRVCAAVVLYKPNLDYLKKINSGLNGCTLFAFLNGPADPDIYNLLDAPNIRLTQSNTNLGLGYGLNAVTNLALNERFSHVLLLDQDSEPSLDMISALFDSFCRMKDLKPAIIAPLLIPPEGEAYKPIRYFWRTSQNAGDLSAVDFTPTSGSMLSLEAFAQIGPFRDDYFIDGIDVEWGFRAWSQKRGSYVMKHLVMPHRWGTEAEKQSIPQIFRQSSLRNYYYARNCVTTAQLPHTPFKWRLTSCLRLALQIAALSLKGEKARVSPLLNGMRDAYLGRMGAAPDHKTVQNLR